MKLVVPMIQQVLPLRMIVIAAQADFYVVEGEALALAVGPALNERRRK